MVNNTKCPARYKNMGLETFGDKKKVTEEFLKQCCKNDEWLRQNLEELRYLTPPAIRKTMQVSSTYDEDKSWGCMVGTDNRVQFSDTIFDKITIDFTTEEGLKKWYDSVKSTTEIKIMPSTNNRDEYSVIQLPYTEVEVQPEEVNIFGTAETEKGYNSAWYVGFDKSKNFYLKPKWIKNWKNVNYDNPKDIIPAIARAQTFKVPGEDDGKLVKVDLQLEYNGTPTLSSSPLYVQIWKTYQGWIDKTEYDKKTNTFKKKYRTIEKHTRDIGEAPPSTWTKYKKVTKKVYYTKGSKKGQVKETKVSYEKDNKNGIYVVHRIKIARPSARGGKTIKSPLAEYEYNPKGSNKGGLASMVFEKPPTLKAGESYAIVLFSPLNNWDNCPRWCGWGRNCKRDALYEDGYAFYSTNNGKSWKVYGKTGFEEAITEYKQGKYVPQDYRFRCYLKTQDQETEPSYETDRIVYMKPIYHNPIYKVEISPTDIGSQTTEQNNGTSIEYQLSTDGDNWYSFGNSDTMTLSEPSRVIFLRALLKTTDSSVTPYIENIDINLWMNPSEEMYVRTKPYTPDKFGTILGANLWGRVFAPYTLENEQLSDCKVDIIEMKENFEYFDIIELDLLDEKVSEKGVPNMEWLENKDDIEDICEYLTENPSILDTLKYDYNLYILPYEIDGEMYNLSFAPSEDELVVEALEDDTYNPTICGNDSTYLDDDDIDSDTYINDNSLTDTTTKLPLYPDNIGGIKLTNEVAYPVLSCELEPEESSSHGKLASFGEWYDYLFDYKTNELIFKRDTLNHMSSGSLTISYNPVFVKDLDNSEVGVHYDDDGNVIEGLFLDYFKEKIEITDEIKANHRIRLRADALDPIRQVYLYSYSEDEPKSLVENHDYFYDLETHEIEFPTLSSKGNTILDKGYMVQVVYTPNLDDTSLCVGYNATRDATNVQCYIEDYYIEYKV